jgi:hypothetical protein
MGKLLGQSYSENLILVSYGHQDSISSYAYPAGTPVKSLFNGEPRYAQLLADFSITQSLDQKVHYLNLPAGENRSTSCAVARSCE